MSSGYQLLGFPAIIVFTLIAFFSYNKGLTASNCSFSFSISVSDTSCPPSYNWCLPVTNCYIFLLLCRLASVDSNFLFLYFQLVFPTLIVLFHTIGVFPSPIVIFSFLHFCYSNLLFALCRFLPFRFFTFCFFAFRFLPFCFFAFVIMRLPKTISLHVSRKLADKTKDEIMTEVLRVFVGLDVKAVQVAYEVVRVPLASPEQFQAAKSFSGNDIFSLCGSLSWGAAPLLCACTFSIFLSKRITDPWRLLSRPMVQSSLSKSRLFFPIKSSLMVPGLSMLSYLGYYLDF